jgi:uncharacterized cupin superfamily protein
MPKEARLARSDSGFLYPEDEGWFVVNARDTHWWHSDAFGSTSPFEGYQAPFQEFGINMRVLQPGRPNCLYHSENAQEAIFVLFGEPLLLIEGEERPLKRWDFVHLPPGTEHVLVGAGDGPSGVLIVGTRRPEEQEEFLYPAAEVARKHNAAAERDTTDPGEAYASYSEPVGGRLPEGTLPD